MSLILGILDSGGAATPAAAPSYESIATVTVGSGGTGTITFSSIPQTYAHLQLRVLGRGTNASSLMETNMKYNSVSNAYTRQIVWGDGSTANVDSRSGSGDDGFFMVWVAGGNAGSNIFGTLLVDILDYTNTSKFTTTRLLTGVELNGSGYVGIESSLYKQTTAVSSITITTQPGGNSFAQYSQFALYGIKGS